MKVVKIAYPQQLPVFGGQPLVLAMGFFDGVHRGHQQVLQQAADLAHQKQVPLAVLTYDHHPALVYQKLDGDAGRYLTLWDRKQELLAQQGVDQIYQINYNFAFQAQTPQQFVDRFLLPLHPIAVVAGFDHTYGTNQADMDHLESYSHQQFSVVKVGQASLGGAKISSTDIRQSLAMGKLTLVNQALGYQFETTGTVIHGFARGRKLGFPTANIQHSELQRLPAEGVYVVQIAVNGRWYQGMASIGRNTTFGDHNPITVEINILDFNQNIYGNQVQIRWLQKLRDNVKYQGEAALIEQLKLDKIATINYFK
ncbi:riboflavin biosynthesis protein RibF [Fructilactobacillus florum]|uniref:riboflavin biosynthesis protein RibF n=1 Tax=Fructilactobacillus florum TaxID=640331 RepID=UPI00028C3D06|nr:riboflavin biosynthesis protein RibF [Fructilactobacillus florum]EKK20215.1 Riboflavin kinase [Fructilactobacillus florum 2F]